MHKQALKSCIFNWSGGKDSSLALYHCLQDPTLHIRYLVTTVGEGTGRVSMHGVRESLLLKQAELIGIPLYQIRLPAVPGMKAYNETMDFHMKKLREEGITHAIYGDIFLEDLKIYREQRLAEAEMKAIFPLWGRNTKEIIAEFLDLGFKTIVVCANEKVGWLAGNVIDQEVLQSLPADVDVCGENGEYHTFTFAGPIFKEPIVFEKGEKSFREFEKPKDAKENCFVDKDKVSEKQGYWYIDLH